MNDSSQNSFPTIVKQHIALGRVKSNDPIRIADSYRDALDLLDVGICFFDNNSQIVFANRQYAEIYRLEPHHVAPGTSLKNVILHRIARGFFAEGNPQSYLNERLRSILTESVKVHRLNDGRCIQVRQHPMPTGGWITMHEDITERTAAEDRVLYMATHDAVTGLSNRRLLQQRIEAALDPKACVHPFALHWIDLDRFKSINDTYGHAFGDELLKKVADRFRACVRSTDTIARLGGDEFAILQATTPDVTVAGAFAERVIRTLSEPYQIDGKVVSIGASTGVTLIDKTSLTAAEIMRQADLAMYRAKSTGGGVYRFFDATMDAQSMMRRHMESDLRSALIRGDLELHYQPIVDVNNYRVTSLEALLRWRKSDGSLISPMAFIPIAEETGLIGPIGDWVIRQACTNACDWPDELEVSVNVSARQFRSNDLVGTVRMALNDTGLRPARLNLEITESVLIDDPQKAMTALLELKSLGVQVSMDDFGTGFSSLSYLSQFPFDKIKIDRSFIKNIASGRRDLSILRSIVGIGRGLGMRTTAEGVETDEQLRLVIAEGVSEVQGYYFSKAVPTSELPATLLRLVERLLFLRSRNGKATPIIGSAVA